MSKLKPYNFRFIKRNGKYIWKNNGMKIVFSDISFQPHDDYAIVKDISDIMYLYYTVKIYQRVTSYNEKTDEDIEYWKKVSEANAYDFPALDCLIRMLEHMLNDKIDKKDGQKITYYTHDIDHNLVPSRYGYEYRMSSEGIVNEDYYEITKVVITDKDEKENESFKIYIANGSAYGVMGGHSVGIRYDRLSRKDLKCLLKCVKTFLQDGIDNYNKILLEITSKKESNFVKNGDYLFELKEENHDIVESIYRIGDKIDNIQIVVGENETLHSVNYHNVNIVNINDEYVYVNDGYKEDPKYYCTSLTDIEALPLNRIAYMFKDVPDELLTLNESEIANMFYELCDDDMKQEFANKSVDELFDKWNEAIADYCWMYRDEHNFPMYIESENHHANVKYVIKRVIEKVKELCN